MSSSATPKVAPQNQGAWPVYRRLLRYAKPFWPVLALALVAMMLEAAAAGAFTALMEPVIDETVIEKNRGTSLWLPAAILGIFLVRGVATALLVSDRIVVDLALVAAALAGLHGFIRVMEVHVPQRDPLRA